MRSGRIIAVVVGAVLTSAGYYMTSTQRPQTSTVVFTTWLNLPDRWMSDRVGMLRMQTTAADGRALFIGIASADAADAWLAGAPPPSPQPPPDDRTALAGAAAGFPGSGQ